MSEKAQNMQRLEELARSLDMASLNVGNFKRNEAARKLCAEQRDAVLWAIGKLSK